MSVIRTRLSYRVRGPFPTNVIRQPISYLVSGPKPSIMVWVNGQWQAVTQRTWTGAAWDPPLI